MDRDTSHDDVLLDRLVDGELTGTERRQLLSSFDERPEEWRRCALRFLESQCLSAELRQFVRPPLAEHATGTAPVLLSAATSPSSRVSHDTEYAHVSWVAMAAGLLIAFTLGMAVRSGGSGGAAPLSGNAVQQHGVPIAQVVPPANGMRVGQAEDALTLFVRDETGQTRPLRVPLVDAAELDRQFGLQFRTGLPDEVRDRLLSRGFDVRSTRRYAPLWLENGRPMFVPVEDTKIVPVSQKVY